MKTIQHTNKTVPDGYWVDPKGRLVPEEMIKESDKERDSLVHEIVTLAQELNEKMTAFKLRASADIQAFIELSAEKYGVTVGGAKGNVTLYSYDGRFRVIRAMQKKITLDEKFQAARQLIDECLLDWVKDTSPEVKAVINQAFATDKKGDINISKLLSLRTLNIQDERWLRAMQAISDAIQYIGSKEYIRIEQRIDDSDQFRPIALNMAVV